MAALPITFQPALLEEVVLRATVGHPGEHQFRSERNRLYLRTDPDERERAFQELHRAWFDRLGLGQPIDAALAELPLLAETCTRCLITQAPTHRDEGADLLVAADTGERTVIIRLRPIAFAAADELLSLLRAELLHVADTVDPAFGYEPALPHVDGGPTYEHLLRERYQVLWSVSVAGRLERRGCARPHAAAEAYRAFAAGFPMLGAATDAAFRRIFDGEARTHADLVQFAAAPRGHGADGTTVPRLAPGDRCPLCRFPTFAPEPAPEQLADDVIAGIVADFPNWQPAHGLCRQCADLYRARTGQSFPANLLIGT